MAPLLLDTAIRDWVVLPMFLLLCLVDIGRQYVQTLIKSAPVVSPKAVEDTMRKSGCLRKPLTRLIHGEIITV